ncbi:maleylpyruvate isomerase family mycothiol-dependent enzyme [Cellulomonas carbonis]|uniref:Mycothiol-dependent maleylpyruvate isomerase metal-binding domain-containing protein n=1 Tax=Cellulomonas carbonis T26 TaxID=947969 RepID=A0A0A0BPS0_9CELL|nr:maleylpyruvate isomerase family mycothiol-dependent enzyme [Cellulomonas carbonis]KGM09955.1 hypothetical protein N868_17500 [Cellulomonas carbonis T26]GGC16689.1 hypothetical protein GCM10010972_32510 [Cellulomonas carbonis]
MDHDRYVLSLREESERFLSALAGVDDDARVPTCDWTVADLVWHLGEVQHFWARVVAGADLDAYVDPVRPPDDDLRDFAATAGTELLAALASRRPDDVTWSWHEDGGTVAWAARRQAHEALVHRVDAELAAGRPVTPPTAELAADGVDELLRYFVHGAPSWGDFTPDGVTVRLEATTTGDVWTLALGRFTGTSPTSGTHHDLDAAALLAEDDGGVDDLVVRGSGWDLDRWLWGRGDAAALELAGDPARIDALASRLRALVADATQ